MKEPHQHRLLKVTNGNLCVESVNDQLIIFVDSSENLVSSVTKPHAEKRTNLC